MPKEIMFFYVAILIFFTKNQNEKWIKRHTSILWTNKKSNWILVSCIWSWKSILNRFHWKNKQINVWKWVRDEKKTHRTKNCYDRPLLAEDIFVISVAFIWHLNSFVKRNEENMMNIFIAFYLSTVCLVVLKSCKAEYVFSLYVHDFRVTNNTTNNTETTYSLFQKADLMTTFCLN